MTREQEQLGAFTIPAPTAPIRDLVIESPSRTEARAAASATASAQRYPVNDGAGRTVAISVDPTCQITCTGEKDPQTIANFLGTLPHGDEMNVLTVSVVTPAQMSTVCFSTEAQACYFPDQDLMYVNGSATTTPPPDNASPNYVIAHEYGHHVANHRDNAPFGNPAIDWGPKNWASFAGVCAGVQAGRYFPGDEGSNYYNNPGEAWAESFAHNRFPTDPVPWEWPNFPDPHTPGGFSAIQQDALHPWGGDSTEVRRGRFSKRGPHRRRITKRFGAPLDGDLTMKLTGPAKSNMFLKLLDSSGHLLATSPAPGPQVNLSYRVCGVRGVSAVIVRRGVRTRFKLTAQIP